MNKQSLQRIIEYSGYADFSEYVVDATKYVERIVAIVKKCNNYERYHKLMRIGSDVGHLPYTYLSNGIKAENDREETKRRLQQYLQKNSAHGNN